MNEALPQASFDKSGSAAAAASVSNDEPEPEPSAPASVHDDADDESELSELDEEEVQEIGQEVEERRSASIATIKPLFPNLLANRASAENETRVCVDKELGGEESDDETSNMSVSATKLGNEEAKTDVDEQAK